MQPPRNKTLRAGLAALGLLAGAAAVARGDDPIEALARALVEKRAAVERLSSEVDQQKTSARDEQRSLALQRGDVDRQVQALTLELEDARRASAELAATLEARRAARAALRPLVVRHLEALGTHVRRGLPFRPAERAAALDELRRELEAGRVPDDEALTRLWSAFEDELRLTRDSALQRQRIEVDGQDLLADVVRLGMVLLYFRTLDGRLGLVVPQGGGAWRFVVATDAGDRARLTALFESFERHVRQGFFELPNPHAEGVQ